MEDLIKTLKGWKEDLENQVMMKYEEIKSYERGIKKKREEILNKGIEIGELAKAIKILENES